MPPSDHPNPSPEIPKNDPPPERQETPVEIDLPPRRLPSDDPVESRAQ